MLLFACGNVRCVRSLMFVERVNAWGAVGILKIVGALRGPGLFFPRGTMLAGRLASGLCIGDGRARERLGAGGDARGFSGPARPPPRGAASPRVRKTHAFVLFKSTYEQQSHSTRALS